MSVKKFHIGDVLSVTADRLVSPRHINGVYDIMNFILSDNLFTHQLVIYHDICRDWLLKQHPELAEVDASNCNRDNWREWLEQQSNRYGKELSVEPMPVGMHDHSHPLEDLLLMVPAEKIIAIEVPEGSE